MKKILVCIGTRPEAIKMAPIIHILKQDGKYEVIVCATGQHRDMVADIFKFFNITPDIDFAVMSKVFGLSDLFSKLIHEFDVYLESIQPNFVLVQGDTTSALAAAVVSHYKQISVGHVEAGLRTGDKYSPWPEEGNRKMLASLADFHFAPTILNQENLIKEGVDTDTIFITGNTVIDALNMTIEKNSNNKISAPIFDIFKAKTHIVLITGHRRENFGEGFKNIFMAIARLAKLFPDVAYVFPVHLNPSVRKQVDEYLRPLNLSNVYLIDPLPYPQFVELMRRAYFILTDSGGIQEEATSLGKPVLITRTTTERPEGVVAGITKVIGIDEQTIVEACSLLLENNEEYKKMTVVSNPYGDGDAAKKIVEIIKRQLLI